MVQGQSPGRGILEHLIPEASNQLDSDHIPLPVGKSISLGMAKSTGNIHFRKTFSGISLIIIDICRKTISFISHQYKQI